MPEMTPIPGLTYDDVQVDDYILGARVEGVRRGTRYVHLTMKHHGAPKSYRHERTSPAPVSRMVETPAERRAQRRADSVQALDYLERRDREALAAAGAEVARYATLGRFPAWDHLERLARLAPTVELWDTLTVRHLRQTVEALGTEDGQWAWGTGGSADVPDRLAVTAELAEDTLDYALRYVSLHGSTSPASRLEDEGRRVGQVEWARTMRDVARDA